LANEGVFKRVHHGRVRVGADQLCDRCTLSESETKNKVYSGTLRHFELKCAHAVCLDFPFSLLADTLALPVTLPWSLVNLMRSDAAQTAQPAQ
jgi:uncharacterized protein YceK